MSFNQTYNDWRICVAPMMDRKDSTSVSIACEVACASRVHAPTWLYYSGARWTAMPQLR